MGTNGYKIIEKGFYSHPQKNDEVQIKQYIITKDGNRRLLLLRFYNNSELVINGMNIILTQLKGESKEPENIKLALNELNIHPGETFAMKSGVVIADDCTDFLVEITDVISKDYIYKESNGKLVAKYDPRLKANKRKNRVSRVIVKRKRVAASKLSALVAIIGIALFLLIGEYLSSRLFGSFSSVIPPILGRF